MIRRNEMAEITRLIADLGAATRALVTNAMELSYFSRGAWSYETVLCMSAAEREIAADFIEKRLEIAAKSAHPVY